MENKKSIDIFPIATFGAGFLAGYKETSGVDLSGGVEFLTKYFPAMFAMLNTSGIINTFRKVSKAARKGIENQDLIINNDKSYSEESFENQVKVSAGVHKFERQTQNLDYPRPLERTLYSGAFAGTTSLLGYWAGSAFAMNNYFSA
jgi:hypothetical protein